MNRRVIPLLMGCVLLCGIQSACTLWPSSWRIGGSPLDKQERAVAKLTGAQDQAVKQAQIAVHQASAALQSAPADNRPVAVARDFVTEAAALLDQAKGAPTAGEVAQLQKLVRDLLSDNQAVRESAEKERSARAGETARLAERLAAATAAAQRANDHALTYAREREELADFAGKLKLGFFALIGLLVLGTLLSVASRFFPALGVASKVINGVVAPGISYVAHRAQEGLSRVGEGMAKLREIASDGESLIERAFDPTVTDADHRAIISAGATAAGSPPKPAA